MYLFFFTHVTLYIYIYIDPWATRELADFHFWSRGRFPEEQAAWDA